MAQANIPHADTDFDLAGIVAIRLVDSTADEVRMVTRQLGPIQGTTDREPDIVIRFVDQLHLSSRLRYLGVEDAGFTDDAFLVLRSRHKARARVKIPFERIGRRCEIVCERGLPAVPLLIPILNLTVLSKGDLPLHASAFVYRDTGVLAAGWAKGGKTETLLSFLANGAQYVGDEWVYLSGDGQRMYGIPEPIRVWNWHLRNLPQFRACVPRKDRLRLRLLNLIVDSIGRLARPGNGSNPRNLLRRAHRLLERQQYVHLPPLKAFGVPHLQPGRPQKVFFLASHEPAEIRVESIDPEEIAQRMVFSHQEELSGFMSYYHKFRFAFPERANPLIERAPELQREALTRVLRGKEAYAVYHPYPVDIPALYDVLGPLCN